MNKPTSITVFGVLNLIFGVLGTCGVGASLVGLLTSQPGTNPVYDIMRQNSILLVWTYVSSALGALFTLLLILSGVGLLMAKSWGRLLGLGYAAATILFGLLGLVVNSVFLVPAMFALTESADPALAGGAIGGIAGAIGGGCVGMVYPILLIFFMTRRPVVDYLAAQR
ncbi:MAG: hypothetical protein JW751_22960 [Polyangiaceae bacterium]|nr:hypothetical protein [Polyangiaceae bacterium]